MKRFLAHLLSIVFIPLLAPTYLAILVLYDFPAFAPLGPFTGERAMIGFIFLTTTLPPFILVFILYQLKIISTLTLDDRKDRLIPQCFVCFNYVLLSVYMVYALGVSNALTLSVIGITVSVLVVSFITPFWKISTHACGVWGITAIVTVLYARHPLPHFLVFYLLLLLLTVAVCLARLYLKVHTPLQVITGSLLGGVVGAFLFLFF